MSTGHKHPTTAKSPKLQKTAGKSQAGAHSLDRLGSVLLVELADSIERLLEIVEGVRGERWQSNGRRLVDTPEWCAFYVAHNKCKTRHRTAKVSSGAKTP